MSDKNSAGMTTDDAKEYLDLILEHIYAVMDDPNIQEAMVQFLGLYTLALNETRESMGFFEQANDIAEKVVPKLPWGHFFGRGHQQACIHAMVELGAVMIHKKYIPDNFC